jgi:hypothetical protein
MDGKKKKGVSKGGIRTRGVKPRPASYFALPDAGKLAMRRELRPIPLLTSRLG